MYTRLVVLSRAFGILSTAYGQDEGVVFDSIAIVQRRRLTRTDMLTTRTHECLNKMHSYPFERHLPAKTLDTSTGTIAVSMLLDVYDDLYPNTNTEMG